MARQTLLDITQDILSEMDSDVVNSIADTVESEDVAKIIRQVYRELVIEHDLPGKQDIIALDAFSDLTKPTHMRIPEGVEKILWVKYDTRDSVSGNKNYTDMKWMEPMDFVNFVNARASTDTDNYLVVQYTANLPLVVGLRQAPCAWTSFDDSVVVFDSLDKAVDSTLQASKVLCQAYSSPDMILEDMAIPDIPRNLEVLLYTQALNRCLSSKKSMVNPKTERVENRFRVRAQRNKWRQGRIVNDSPDYGRR
jgi:hypothetical protein